MPLSPANRRRSERSEGDLDRDRSFFGVDFFLDLAFRPSKTVRGRRSRKTYSLSTPSRSSAGEGGVSYVFEGVGTPHRSERRGRSRTRETTVLGGYEFLLAGQYTRPPSVAPLERTPLKLTPEKVQKRAKTTRPSSPSVRDVAGTFRSRTTSRRRTRSRLA